MMRNSLIALALLIGARAQGAPSPETLKAVLEAQPTCGNFVRYDEQNIYLGFGSYRNGFEEPRKPIPSKIGVAPLDGTPAYSLFTKDATIDAVTDGASTFVLTYSAIEEWNLATKTRTALYPTYAVSAQMAYQEHAQGFARFGDKLIIAHGRLGISFFDMKTKRITNQYRLLQEQLPLESMAVGVTVQGNLAYVAVDNVSLVSQGKPPFRGIIVINMETEQIVSQLDGMDPGSDSIVSDGRVVIVSFGGIPIWKYTRAELHGRSIPEPEIRIWKFPVGGHPTGAPSMDDKYYYSCFMAQTTGGHYKKVPMALNRSQLMLD